MKEKKKESQSDDAHADKSQETGRRNRAGKKPAKFNGVDERLLRLQADFENFRKRTVREKEDLYRRANEDLFLELLPVLDHMDLALSSVNNSGQDTSFVQGIRLVSEQMLAALAKFGLTPIDADGQEFDPSLHEAISHLPSEDFAPGMVITQTRRGYKVGERVLRAAQVVVSKGTDNDEAEPETAVESDDGSRM